jgi:PhzF family phenazine biosynthesis protein
MRRYLQVDVFSDTILKGNGLAVVIDGQGLSEQQMQEFSIWTQQAETTFLLPPRKGADYRVRIFSATGEMRFAGHPTLGSCAAWLYAGGVPQQAGRVIQDCGVGLVEIDLTGAAPAFVAPPTGITEMNVKDREAICGALGIATKEVVNAVRLDNGVVRNLIELSTASRVLSLDATAVSKPAFDGVSVIGAHPPDSDATYEIRNLTPASLAAEDPVTGSLIAAAACWLRERGRLTRPIVMAQGTAMGREGRAFVTLRENADVMIGGHTAIVIDGHVNL